MDFLDKLVILAYIAFNLDIILQIRRIYHTKSSKDLSLPGMLIRCAAIIIFLFKYTEFNSSVLIAGQTAMAILFTAYFILALTYRKRRTQA